MSVKLLVAAAVVAATLVIYKFNTGSEQSLPTDTADSKVEPAPADNDSSVESPFAILEPTENTTAPASVNKQAGVINGPSQNDTPTPSIQSADQAEIDVHEIGRESIEGEDYGLLVARLQADPQLLQLLLESFRNETDPERLQRLVQLLGDVNQPAVLDVASEYIYSGDPALAALGRSLLMRVQPGSEEARSIISGLLSTETDSKAIVGALAGITQAGDVDDDSRGAMAEQVALLTLHEDAVVRRNSLTILSRWSQEPRHTALLLDGLDDADASVRKAAAFAMVDHNSTDENAMQRLLTFAENTAEGEQARRAAILALKGMPLSEYQMDAVLEIEKSMDRRPLRTQ